MEASRQILWNMHADLFLASATILTAASLIIGFAVRISGWRRGREGTPSGPVPPRLNTLLTAIFNQQGMLRGKLYLVMHRCIFFGICLLAAGSLLVALTVHLGIPYLHGRSYLYYSFVLDAAGVAVFVGTILAAYKRYVVAPDRLDTRPGDAFLLIALAVLIVTGFLLKGLRLYATSDPFPWWSPLAGAMGSLAGKLAAAEQARVFHSALWYGHAVLALVLVALIPWTKLLHMVTVPANIFLSVPWDGRAHLAVAPAALPFTGAVSDFTAKQLMESHACLQCGRCKKLCALHQRETPAAPAATMRNLRRVVGRRRFSSPVVGEVIDRDAVWSCTMCRSCEERCPMEGEHATTIAHIRRGCVERGDLPEHVQARFSDNEKALAENAKQRQEAPEDCDIYLWPGCRETKTEQSVTLRKLLELLEYAKVSVAVLEPPACCGSSVRRLGNEELFQHDAEANIAYLDALKGKTIVTPCAHCFNTLRHEYPSLGAELKVMHHSQYLAKLISQGKLRTGGELSGKAVFHDPCFLGRYNREFSAPRNIIAAAEHIELLEMKHSRMKSYCCGSGGGTVPEADARRSAQTILKEAGKIGAEAIVTACPYCHENLSASAGQKKGAPTLRVLDVVEILETHQEGSLPR